MEIGQSSAKPGSASDHLFGTGDKGRKTRLLYGGLAVLTTAVVALFIALVVVATKDSDSSSNSPPAWTAPECSRNPASATPDLDTAKCILEKYPLIDGHNDLASSYRRFAENKVYTVDLRSDLSRVWTVSGVHDTPSQTDIPRLRRGRLGAQFWSCYVGCRSQYKDAVRMSLDQLDVIKKFVTRYPGTFRFVTTAQGILDAFRDGRIGGMVGLEGGHSIDSSLGNLRMFYSLGVRYVTLTHSCNTPWADNWIVDTGDYNVTAKGPIHGGLTAFGEKVVQEMNRLGMLVDLSHVAKKTMIKTLETTKAPVIYSHTSAYALCNHYRNVQDDVLHLTIFLDPRLHYRNIQDDVLYLTKANGGVVMVNFYDAYINCPPGNQSEATLSQVADHIEYIKNLIGVDYVGIGADYDGVPTLPVGLEDVSTYPALFAELVKRNWTDDELMKLAGKNLIRVFTKVEQVRDEMAYMDPLEDLLPVEEYITTTRCRTGF